MVCRSFSGIVLFGVVLLGNMNQNLATMAVLGNVDRIP
jgi:hypothetical protein